MNKVVHIEITHCAQCPHNKEDANSTRSECRKDGNTTIYWNCDPRETEPNYIPDWCPLWLEQNKNIKLSVAVERMLC